MDNSLELKLKHSRVFLPNEIKYFAIYDKDVGKPYAVIICKTFIEGTGDLSEEFIKKEFYDYEEAEKYYEQLKEDLNG